MDFSVITGNKFKIEEVFFDAGYPMLFSARDKQNRLFLCVCCQRNRKGTRWLLKETTPSVIVRMLKDQITLRDSFLEGYGLQCSYFLKYKRNGKTKILYKVNNPKEWNAEKSYFLPDAGEFIEAEEGEFDEEISFYENQKEVFAYGNLTSLFNQIDYIKGVSIMRDFSICPDCVEYNELSGFRLPFIMAKEFVVGKLKSITCQDKDDSLSDQLVYV